MLRTVARVASTSDRAAGGLARGATTAGQLALVALGVHLAADRLDDLVFSALTLAERGLDHALLAPAISLAETLGMDAGALVFWQEQPLAAAAAWTALGLELGATVVLWSAFLLSSRTERPSWVRYKRALSVHAVVMPAALAGVVIAGAWSLSMAIEDLLPASTVAPWAAGILAGAALIRFGWPAWQRSVSALDPPKHRRQGLAAAVALVPIGALAWLHGVPLWGWARALANLGGAA